MHTVHRTTVPSRFEIPYPQTAVQTTESQVRLVSGTTKCDVRTGPRLAICGLYPVLHLLGNLETF